jgi:hypothetical protein
MAVGIVPSLVTVSAPSYLRSIAVLIPLALCVALVVDLLPRRLGWSVGLAVVALTGLADTNAYFQVWPKIPEVRTIYRDDLEQLARALESSGVKRALVSTPDAELDARLFPFYLPPEDVLVSFFDGDTNFVRVHGADLFESPLSPLSQSQRAWLSRGYGAIFRATIPLQNGDIAFDHFRLVGGGSADTRLRSAEAAPVYTWDQPTFRRGALDRWATALQLPVNFGGVVDLIGVELSPRPIATEFDGVNLQLFLHPRVANTPMPLNIFVHVVTPDGTIHAQRDLLGVIPEQWQTDMTIIQDHFVVMGPSSPGPYIVVMGIYDVETGIRLPVLDTEGNPVSDTVLLGRVIVGE